MRPTARNELGQPVSHYCAWPMSADHRMKRPATPEGFDASRAAERGADPEGWRYSDDARETVYRVMRERRDIRRFRPDPVPDDVLLRILTAAHSAPSVGLMQPWRLILVRRLETRVAIRQLAQRERVRQGDRFGPRTRQFLEQKVEGVVEAPLGICVCCDHGEDDVEVLGRGSIPETDVYSVACAIENLWLAARAEGVGVGWVSFYRADDLRGLLGIPSNVDPIAYLCIGWPDERPVRPGLEAAGWAARMPLEAVVMQERWRDAAVGGASSAITAPDRSAAAAARDHLDQLVKPVGSLGILESLIERWASITGAAPPARIRAGVLVFAADHGHVVHGTSLFTSEVSAQVAGAAARGETVVGVLARRGGHQLVVADVGLLGPTPAGVRDVKVAEGARDMVTESALTPEMLAAAIEAGAALAGELADGGVDCLVLGEIGIGNTATAAALAAALTGTAASSTVGRGTGVDAQGLDRKTAVVASSLERRGPFDDPTAALVGVGGLEFAAIVGAIHEAARRSLPVVLDGYAVTVAALAATRLDQASPEVLIAGHRSSEAGHALVLAELGLEPLLDLRMRVGEASGGLLALSVIEAAGALFRDMGTFEDAGIAPRD